MQGSVTGRRRIVPSASVARAVESLFLYEVDGERPHVGIPHPEIDLVVRFGSAPQNGIDAHAFGARERIHRKTPRGVSRTVTARLRLGAPRTVLGVPPSQIAGRIVALEDLWGAPATRRLFDRLAAARDGIDATRTLEAAIAERLAMADAPTVASPLALDAADLLGRTNVRAVADELGVSGRHLRRVFHDSVGLGPKTFAKLERFHRALRAAREDDRPGWAQIAVTAGYYDQAHLIAEFRAIAGTTPSKLLQELRAAPTMG